MTDILRDVIQGLKVLDDWTEQNVVICSGELGENLWVYAQASNEDGWQVDEYIVDTPMNDEAYAIIREALANDVPNRTIDYQGENACFCCRCGHWSPYGIDNNGECPSCSGW